MSAPKQPKALWYTKIGFTHNPFSIKPAIVNDKLIGNSEKLSSVEDFIIKGTTCIIEGKYGVGKTTFLKKLIDKFAGEKRVVYLACNRIHQKINLDKLLHGRYGTIGKFLKLKPKNMILLLDEADHLQEDDFRLINQYRQDGYFKSVVLVAPNANDIKLPKAYKLRLKDSIFSLSMVSKDDAIELIRHRIGFSDYICDKNIGLIYEKSQSARVFLKNCEDACRTAFENKHKHVTQKDIDHVFNNPFVAY
jgi:Cdc6-like AAA superfamily ATPase